MPPSGTRGRSSGWGARRRRAQPWRGSSCRRSRCSRTSPNRPTAEPAEPSTSIRRQLRFPPRGCRRSRRPRSTAERHLQSSGKQAGRTGVSYRMRGTYYENCNCDALCPCSASNLLLPADEERCHLLLAYKIDSGDVDGVDVSGTAAAILVDTPQQMSDGGWRAGIFLDAGATDEQREKLQAVFSGQQGGPAASFAPLGVERLGVATPPIECSDDGRSHSLRIGDAVDLQFEDFAGRGEGS